MQQTGELFRQTLRIPIKTALFVIPILITSPSAAQMVIDLANETPGSAESVMSLLGKEPLHMLGSGGTSMTMGDFNGDSIGDCAIAAPSADTVNGGTGTGEIYIFYGQVGAESIDVNLSDDSSLLSFSRVFGGIPYEHAGQSLASGDINGDRYDDLVIGAPASLGSGTQQAGTIYVVYGSPDLPMEDVDLGISINSMGATRILGNEAFDVTGWAVATGDVNSDGFDDIIFSSLDWGREVPPGSETSWRGKVQIIYGSAAIPQTIVDLSQPIGSHGETTIIGVDDFTNQKNGDQFGRSLASADVNGDGYEDVIIGAPISDRPDHSAPDAGEVWIVYGSATIPNSTLDLSDSTASSQATAVLGDKSTERTGFSVATGDINGDGYAEVLIGSPYVHKMLPLEEFQGAKAFEVGQVDIVFGTESLPGRTLDLQDSETLLNDNEIGQIVGPASSTSQSGGPRLFGGRFGWAIDTSDLNGDGRDDVISSAPFIPLDRRRDAGQVSILYGNAVLEGASLDLDVDPPDIRVDGRERIVGTGIYEYFGKAISGGGDLNGDGFSDVFSGSPFSENPEFPEVFANNAGESIGVFGSGMETTASRVRYTRSGDAPMTGFGPVLRCQVDYAQGDNISQTEVTLNRRTEKGPPQDLVSWRVQTDRQNYGSAAIRVRYLDSEIVGVNEGQLRLSFSSTGDAFEELPDQTIDFARNEILATIDDVNGTIVLGVSEIEITPTPTIDPEATPTIDPEITPTIDPNASATPMPADINEDGKVDSRDLMMLLNDWMKEEGLQ